MEAFWLGIGNLMNSLIVTNALLGFILWKLYRMSLILSVIDMKKLLLILRMIPTFSFARFLDEIKSILNLTR